MNNETFVYCWTDHKDEKLYVGYHKGTPVEIGSCDHCGKTMNTSNIARWHNDRCKSK